MKNKTFFVIVFVVMLSATIISAAEVLGQNNINITILKCPGKSYEIINDSVVCVSCSYGFDTVNGSCVPEETEAKGLNMRSTWESFIDVQGAKLTPENPGLGRTILMVGSVVVAFLIFAFVFKIINRKVKKK